MSVEIGVVISLISAVLAIASFAFARKKENKTDGFELGQFTGEIKSEIKSIRSLIEELKRDNKEVDDKIIKAIREHELHYNDKISKIIADHEMRYHNHN